MTEKNEKDLQTCENNWVRRMCRVRKVDRVRVEDMRERLGIKMGVKRKIVMQRMRWAGHVARMPDDRIPKRALLEVCEGKRPRGRPPTRWNDGVVREWRKCETQEAWRDVAQDREAWRNLIYKVD